MIPGSVVVLFDSPVYIAFLVVVVLAYWRLGWRRQNVMLLLACHFFHARSEWRLILRLSLGFVRR